MAKDAEAQSNSGPFPAQKDLMECVDCALDNPRP